MTATLFVLAFACAAAPRVSVAPADRLAAVAERIGRVGEGDALVVAAGDIADCGEQLEAARATAALVKLFPSATVIIPGDTVYPNGSREDYARCYEPTWGAFKSRTRPAPGNHEYRTPGAAGYFEYFGVPPFYSFDLGGWHVVSLDSMRDIGAQSAQVVWLRSDLDATVKPCILAFWHHPRFSSGVHGRQPDDRGRQTGAMWSVLAQHGAAVVVNGHDHHYERFARIDGIRQFVAGTGGARLRPALFP
jgi:alkaline phosphatase